MGRVSRNSLSPEALLDLQDHFTYLISTLSKKSDIDHFLQQFLTDEEKIMLSKRLMLYMMIKQKYHEDAIQAVLRMSHESIRTYRLALKLQSAFFHEMLEKLIKRETSKVFWKKVERFLEGLDIVMTAKTNMRSRAKLATGQAFHDD